MLTLQVLIPAQPDCPVRFEIEESACGEELLQRVSKEAGVLAAKLTLFARNMQGDCESILRVDERKTLAAQGVKTGALVSCMVEEVIEECGEGAEFGKPPAQVPDTSGSFKEGCGMTEEPEDVEEIFPLESDDEDSHDESPTAIDIQEARKTAVDMVDSVFRSLQHGSGAAVESGKETHKERLSNPPPVQVVGPVRRIASYSWFDRRSVVKVYIQAESEPDAVADAGHGSDSQVRLNFAECGVSLVVHGTGMQHVLELHNLRGPIVPHSSRCVVQVGKRIVLELRKLGQGEEWQHLTQPWIPANADWHAPE